MGTLSLPTTQDLFDHVVAHLLRQGRKSQRTVAYEGIPSSVACCYRGDDGRRCAAGCLIDSARYRSDFEGVTLDAGPKAIPVLDAIDATLGRHLSIPEKLLVARLQFTHDWNEVEDWPKMLAEVAAEFGLTFNSPVDVKA